MCKNIVQRGRLHLTIRRMRIACWIPKATNTHSQYVILLLFHRTRLGVTLHRTLPVWLLLEDFFEQVPLRNALSIILAIWRRSQCTALLTYTAFSDTGIQPCKNCEILSQISRPRLPSGSLPLRHLFFVLPCDAIHILWGADGILM